MPIQNVFLSCYIELSREVTQSLWLVQKVATYFLSEL